MKKNIVLVFILGILCILAVGCGKKESNKKWETNLEVKQLSMSNEATGAFNKATKNSDKKYEAVALLATQVVSGTNYMFLAIEDNSNYKILVIYNDLSNKASIIYNNSFDYTKYTSKNIEFKKEEIVGGWSVFNSPLLFSTLKIYFDSNIPKGFADAVNSLENVDYYPIAVMGQLDEDGKKYAILCFGSNKETGNDKEVFLVTYHEKSEDKHEIISSAYVDLKDFAK